MQHHSRYLSHFHVAIVCSACVTNISQSTSQLLLQAASKSRQNRHRDLVEYPQSPGEGSYSKFAFYAELFRFEYSSLAQEVIRNSLLVESMRMIINKECDRLPAVLHVCPTPFDVLDFVTDHDCLISRTRFPTRLRT